jgi:hypothetical protein
MADNLTAIYESIVSKCGSLDASQPCGRPGTVTGIALFFFYLASVWMGYDPSSISIESEYRVAWSRFVKRRRKSWAELRDWLTSQHPNQCRYLHYHLLITHRLPRTVLYLLFHSVFALLFVVPHFSAFCQFYFHNLNFRKLLPIESKWVCPRYLLFHSAHI